VCLTVTRLAGPRVGADATAETRLVSTLKRWRVGDLVHLEPALRAGDALGGHFVLGHVDGTGRVARLERRSGAVWMTVMVDSQLAAHLLPKGSIAVDGVSLTLDAGPFPGRFTVTLVPHTLAITRFGRVAVGELVNIELDVLAKAATAGHATPSSVAPSASSQTGSTDVGAAARPAVGEPLTIPSILMRGWGRRPHTHS
jgi:riboflavin synthase